MRETILKLLLARVVRASTAEEVACEPSAESQAGLQQVENTGEGSQMGNRGVKHQSRRAEALGGRGQEYPGEGLLD